MPSRVRSNGATHSRIAYCRAMGDEKVTLADLLGFAR
jgi:hypothetical protein